MAKMGIIMNSLDNVVTALEDIAEGEEIEYKIGKKKYSLKVKQFIPKGHKVAIKSINAGEKIIKYGVPVGQAKFDIEIGEHVHIHNVRSLRTEVI